MTDHPSQTPRTDEMSVYGIVGKGLNEHNRTEWVRADFARQLERELSAARRDAELLDGIEKHKLTIYHTWRDKTESGWTYWEMFGPEGPDLFPTAREAIRAGIDDAVAEAKLDAALPAEEK